MNKFDFPVKLTWWLFAGVQVLQYDMWGVTPTDLWDWAALKEKIAKHGIRNSLLLAPMPTASTAQILGNNESIEAYTSNIYVRRVLSGEFQVGYFLAWLLFNNLIVIYAGLMIVDRYLGGESPSVARFNRGRSVEWRHEKRNDFPKRIHSGLCIACSSD